MNNPYLQINPEVAQAVAQGKPVVALESTIISHGMPYPQNVETALAVEKIIRDNGAVPATIAILGGKLVAGLTPEQIEYFGKKGQAIAKASRRDLAVLCAKGEDGATTVATTMLIAHMAGIRIFATGGIGGVHRGAETTMDISADLEELAHTPVMVICAGPRVFWTWASPWSIWKPTAFPCWAMAPRSCLLSTPAPPASPWITGWIRRRSWRKPSWPRIRWAWAAACW